MCDVVRRYCGALAATLAPLVRRTSVAAAALLRRSSGALEPLQQLAFVLM